MRKSKSPKFIPLFREPNLTSKSNKANSDSLYLGFVQVREMNLSNE